MSTELKGISIITIVKNGIDFIEETILSVIHQKGVEIEYIIIDGNSEDGTKGVIKKYNKGISHFISESDGGIYQAINKGISLATMPIIGLIHSGDCYLPGALKKVINSYNKYGSGIYYGDIIIREIVDHTLLSTLHSANFSEILKRMSIFHPSTFIARDYYIQHGLYDTHFKSASDYDLLLKFYYLGLKFRYVEGPLAIFSAGGISSSNFKLSRKENFKIRLKYQGSTSAIKYYVSRSFHHYLTSLRNYIFIFLFGIKMFNKLKIRKYSKKLLPNG
jgi:glycosyltransferase involved in cell wall biosynthesis